MTAPCFVPRAEPLADRLTPAVTFRFDYSLDTSGLFNDPAARAALQQAADALGSQLQDALAPIAPAGGNSWTASFLNPVTNRTERLSNLVVGANEIVVLVAAANLPGGDLGVTGGGSVSARGSTLWVNTATNRGQAAGSDYGPWGGMIAFDSQVPWSFDPNGPPRGEYDFKSVAEHELEHLLGFGIGAASFDRYVNRIGFVGPFSDAVYSGAVPLSAGGGHWATGTEVGGLPAAMAPSLPSGTRRELTPLDWAALADIGWAVSPPPPVTVSPPPPATVTPPPAEAGAGAPRVVVGAGEGGSPVASWLDAAGRVVESATVFDAGFSGGVRVASADFTRDGVLDAVVGTGPGAPTRVRVLSGSTQREVFAVTPFEPGFTGGVFVAAGDVTGDGVPDLVVSPDVGGGPRVRVYDGRTFAPVADFFAIDDPNFRGGARVAVGDVNGDGAGDLVVAAGAGGGPRVAGFDGRSLAGGPKKLFADFFAFEPALVNGVYVAAGDLDGDGKAEVIAGGGPGGGPRVTAFSGRDLLVNAPTRTLDFFAGDPDGRGGARVAVTDLDGDGRGDLIAGAGTGSQVTAYDAATRPLFARDAFPGFAGGVFVG